MLRYINVRSKAGS